VLVGTCLLTMSKQWMRVYSDHQGARLAGRFRARPRHKSSRTSAFARLFSLICSNACWSASVRCTEWRGNTSDGCARVIGAAWRADSRARATALETNEGTRDIAHGATRPGPIARADIRRFTVSARVSARPPNLALARRGHCSAPLESQAPKSINRRNRSSLPPNEILG